MAEVLINSQSPVVHQVFWNGDIAVADNLPTVKLYDVTMDPAISPAINPTHLIAVLTSAVDETNPGTYVLNIPYQYTNRNKTLRLLWEYSIGGVAVAKSQEVFVVTPYVDLTNSFGSLGISTDPSDPNYKSYSDLIKAEKYARKQIESYTKQSFFLYDDLHVAYGYDSDILPLPAKINEIHELYANDVLLLDTINEIDNWNYPVEISESGYGIKINRAGLIDNTVYTANGMIPPSIHDSSGVFQSGVSYRVQGRFGWEKVPDNVELAAIELMKDYFSKDTIWRNKYVKTISTFDWDFEYNGNAYTGTGNAYADSLLNDYILDTKVEII
jgi:hypothetical protein